LGIVSRVSTSNSDPGIRALGDLARQLDPRVVGVSTRTKDAKTVLIIELAGATHGQHESLADALRKHRIEHGISTEFLIFNATMGFDPPPGTPEGEPP
jgi:hypothetical protein